MTAVADFRLRYDTTRNRFVLHCPDCDIETFPEGPHIRDLITAAHRHNGIHGTSLLPIRRTA